MDIQTSVTRLIKSSSRQQLNWRGLKPCTMQSRTILDSVLEGSCKHCTYNEKQSFRTERLSVPTRSKLCKVRAHIDAAWGAHANVTFFYPAHAPQVLGPCFAENQEYDFALCVEGPFWLSSRMQNPNMEVLTQGPYLEDSFVKKPEKGPRMH